MEVTSGNARAAAPILHMAALRDARTCASFFFFTNSPDFDSLRKVSQTNSSSTEDCDSFDRIAAISATVLVPSQSFHTSAAVRFKQCALWFSFWYTSVSSPTFTTMPRLWMGGAKFDALSFTFLTSQENLLRDTFPAPKD
jgi:hypothetical protein